MYKHEHIGPMPPPLGGISVYLYRLSKIEKYSIFFSFARRGSFFLWSVGKLVNLEKKQIFSHVCSFKQWLVLWLLNKVRGHRYVIVSHGDGLKDMYTKSKGIKKNLLKTIFKNAEYIQSVNPENADFMRREIGIKRVIVKNAFLPPPLEDEEKILHTYEPNLFEFLKNHEPIIIANAFHIVFYNGEDLYGLDMCVELTRRLKAGFPKLGFLFAIAEQENESDYLTKMKDIINTSGIEENFYFLTGQKEIWPLFKKANLMVRPTNTDGYGISIAEAIYFGCPAVASDVCVRAKGTIIFKSRDIDDFTLKVKAVLERSCHVKIC